MRTKVEPVIVPGKMGGWRPNSGRKPGFVSPMKGKPRPDMIGNKFNKGQKGEDNYFSKVKFRGKDHAHWKGGEVGYMALHTWVARELGKSDTCEFCHKTGLSGKNIHWANKSHEYKRELSDWIRLCAKCHYHYDRD